MPTYQLQSALGAGLADAAGFMAGQTERKRYLAEQQMQANRDAQAQAEADARLGLERSNQEATNAYRTTQTQQRSRQLDIDAANSARADAAAEAAAQKQKLLEAFQAKGLHYPKNYATMKPEQKIAYLQVRLNNAQKAGDTKTVSDTETEINRVATEAAAAQRQADLEKQRNTQNANTSQRIQIQLDRPPPGSASAVSEAERVREFNLLHPTDPKTGKLATKPPPRDTTPQARSADYNAAAAAIAKGADRDAVVKRYAAKWNLDPAKVDGLFP